MPPSQGAPVSRLSDQHFHLRRASMNVEYTGRQFEVTLAIRMQVEAGLQKIQKILGNHFDTHVILSAEKHRHVAEINVTVRNHPAIVGLAEAPEMSSAVGNALDHIHRQAVKYKTRWKSKKRIARKKFAAHPPREMPLAVAVGAADDTAVPVTVHWFPTMVELTEHHAGRIPHADAYTPMNL